MKIAAWPVKNIKIYNNNNKKEFLKIKIKDNFFSVKYVRLVLSLN